MDQEKTISLYGRPFAEMSAEMADSMGNTYAVFNYKHLACRIVANNYQDMFLKGGAPEQHIQADWLKPVAFALIDYAGADGPSGPAEYYLATEVHLSESELAQKLAEEAEEQGINQELGDSAESDYEVIRQHNGMVIVPVYNRHISLAQRQVIKNTSFKPVLDEDDDAENEELLALDNLYHRAMLLADAEYRQRPDRLVQQELPLQWSKKPGRVARLA